MSKNKLTIADVHHVAKLANLPLTDKEVTKYNTQLAETLDYMSDLNELNTNNIVPTPQVTGKENELREDEIKPSLSQKDALKNAKSHNGFFVSKISWS